MQAIIKNKTLKVKGRPPFDGRQPFARIVSIAA